MMKQTFNPCDECTYNFSKNNQEISMCKICEFKGFINAEKQGLLLRLPCKVGDTVWCIFEGNVYEAIAQKVTIVTGLYNYQLIKIEAEFNIIDPYYIDGRTIKYGIYQNYLETVFLTQAEAEQKLKETEGD